MKALKVSILNVVVIKLISVGFLPRALALGMGNKGDLRSVRRQKQEGPVVRGNVPTAVSMEDKLKEGNLMEDKLSSKSVKSLSCHPRSPDGRMLA